MTRVEAKAGDTITTKARERLRKALGAPSIDNTPSKVEPKSEGDAGQWFCIDCGELPSNNMNAHAHIEEKPRHRLAWRSFVTGNIEAA